MIKGRLFFLAKMIGFERFLTKYDFFWLFLIEND